MAIAFNAATDGGTNFGGGTTLTFAHTVGGGSDRLLVVTITGDSGSGADDVSSVTFNSVAMTLAVKRVTGLPDRFLYQYFLLNPDSGTYNVVITCASTHYIFGGAADYTGVAQSGQPDATTTNFVSGATSLVTALTTVADNCWVMLSGGQNYTGAGPLAAGTGATRRAYEGVYETWAHFDSNGPVTPAGSYSMTTTAVGSRVISHAMASYAPATGGGATSILRQMMQYH